jgi:flagellar basal-body rod protein FlgC
MSGRRAPIGNRSCRLETGTTGRVLVMAFDDLLVSGNISASGMTAERLRMEVIASNVANALSTRTSAGGPYRRQDVLFEAVMQDQLGTGAQTGPIFSGVRVSGVQDDPSELPRIHDPGHPDADSEGFVTMPNVFLPIEMVNLMTASRAYEANLKVLQTLRQQLEQTLTLLKY